MLSTWLTLFFLVAAASTAAVVNDDPKPMDKSTTNSTYNPNITATPAAMAKADDVGDAGEPGPHKRTIEQAIGYGYRYNTVLRPIPSSAASNPITSSSRRQPTYQQRVVAPSGPSPTAASYYYQQLQTTSPKPSHRFAGGYPSYPRTYNRQEAPETRPVTEPSVPVQSPQEAGLYREVFTFDEAVPAPYPIAARAEHPVLTPHAFLLTPGHLGGQPQQVIPVLILRLDGPAHYPYPMMAMQILQRDDMAKLYASSPDPTQLSQQYLDTPSTDVPSALAYYMAAAQQQYVDEKNRRVQPLSTMQQERYRSTQNEQAALAKALRRPGTSGSGVTSTGSAQSARTEVTIHHSPGMSAQDYKDSVEETVEA